MMMCMMMMVYHVSDVEEENYDGDVILRTLLPFTFPSHLFITSSLINQSTTPRLSSSEGVS